MTEIDVDLLGKYLRRCVAEKNKTINGLCKSFVEEGRIFRNDIYREFARGNDFLYKIDRDIAYRGKKDVAIYNYFDLDTIIAYNKYLESIIKCVESNKAKSGRRYTVPRDMSSAIHEYVPKYFIFHQNEPSTGFYNLSQTITPLFDENKHLTYVRTPEKSSFEKKYDERELSHMLDKYIDSRYYKSMPKEESEEDAEEEYEPESICTMKIYNRDYDIYRIEDYFDRDFAPIKYVEGERDRYAIRGFVDMNGREFNGDVFDSEGELIVESTQTGLETYVDGIIQDKKYKY